jgi:HK97 family phage major capsid protein
MSALLEHLHATRAAHLKTKNDVIAAVEARHGTQLTPAETASVTEARTAIAQIDGRIAELEDEAGRDARTAAFRGQYGLGATASVTSEPGVYRGEHGGPSFVRDLAAQAIRGYAPDASERLTRHMTGVRAESRALSTTDGAGGEFVPPLWMVDKYVKVARAGRITADRLTASALPTGTDSINVPKFTSGTAVAEQTSQNSAIQNTDAVTTSVSASVLTFAGAQTVSLQAIEQSPINLDEALLSDLLGSYATQLDVAVLTRNTAGGLGLLGAGLSGVSQVTYTDATPTVGELYPKLNDAIQRVALARFMGADCIVMHPRRWAWILSQLDTAGRPLVVPGSSGPLNALAVMQDGAPAQGYAGDLLGLPVFLDPSIPINLGAGTNEDRILIGRFSEAVLYEGTPRLESFRDTKADTLAAFLRLYNYAAFSFQRYPGAFSVISGTGLITPTF